MNTAPREWLLRIPGVGVRGVERILATRVFQKLTYYHLKQMGITLSRAKYFITCSGAMPIAGTIEGVKLRQLLLSKGVSKYKGLFTGQLSLFD